ncbi:hypothetical protein HON22_00250 [Candidatus Peregrinibacteria bacterium]|nr:hypothetical protein [Candidatus Peregrinibacteria bacterium]
MGFILDKNIILEAEEEKTETEKGYTLKLGDSLFSRIDNHLLQMKYLSSERQSRQNWILNAVKEKLNQDLLSSAIPKIRSTTLRIDPKTFKKLDQRVEFIKKIRGNFTKKHLIVEAIEEKLEREKQTTQSFKDSYEELFPDEE